jgi:hypothetical protein
LLAEHELEA